MVSVNLQGSNTVSLLDIGFGSVERRPSSVLSSPHALLLELQEKEHDGGP